jgi:hypothetical protein
MNEPLTYLIYESSPSHRDTGFCSERGWVQRMHDAQEFHSFEAAEDKRLTLKSASTFVFAVMPTL